MIEGPRRIILASTSPRRGDILKKAGYDFETRPHRADEIGEGDPYRIVVKNAAGKAQSISAREIYVIIGADTVVLCDGEVLGKPRDREDARRMVELQLRYPQKVITGICVIDRSTGREFTGYEVSTVVMEGEMDALEKHIESGQWEGKAGAYGIQDRGPLNAKVVIGNEDNVVGLPMTLVRRLLSLVGFKYPEKIPAGE